VSPFILVEQVVRYTFGAKVLPTMNTRVGLRQEPTAEVTVEKLSHLLVNYSHFVYLRVVFSMEATEILIIANVIRLRKFCTNNAFVCFFTH
jgi:hypothetical protein